MDRLPIGLFGVGRWGSNYLKLLTQDEGFELVSVLDPDPAARARIEASKASAANSIDEVLASGARAVVIATPPDTHANLARRALEAGLHVLVEKPLATRVTDAAAVVQAASSRVVLVGHLVLHVPVVRQVLESVAKLGAPRRTNHVRVSSGARYSAEDPLWALGPHDIALSLRMMRALPTSVRARRNGNQIEAVARYADLRESTFLFSRDGASAVRRLEVETEDRVLVADERTGRLEIRSAAVGTRTEVHEGPPPLQTQCDHFRRCVRGEANVEETTAESVANVRILAAMTQSLAHDGAWVTLGAEETATARTASPMNAAVFAASD